MGPSTFKPLMDEGYTLPLVVTHYDVPGKYHEYAEPLPPEPEYATPFGEPDGPRGIPGLLVTPSVRYDAPTPRAGEWGTERTAGDAPSPEGSQLGDCPLSHVYHEAL
ncbi:cub and lccl domain-containing protein 1-like [Limosa lapponica baueri]|uniref:Cub and lccl domain-containing protein 1-like n=1 Tax=Limosa lapponica baueri TaxID=1758121 RepID=A0A2I0SZ28_LIMLA|nr:cub and lccl domain-containing protein 1-like [Limosa lapponica baueri]